MTLLLLLNVDDVLAGPYVVTLPNITPLARHDGTPWAQIRIEEAATHNGTWTELITNDITPLDQNPATPATRNITISGATLITGWYKVTFLDTDDKAYPLNPIRSRLLARWT